MQTPPSSGFSPISRLPNELLTTIFAMRRDGSDGYSTKEDYCFFDTSMTWVYLMLVSRHWRAVGISSPWLWRRISVTKNMVAVQYRLSRAKGCTIDITFSNDPNANKCAMPLLLPFAPYIRSMETRRYHFPFSGLPSIKPLLQVPLPVLECVELASDGGHLFDLGLSGELHPRIRKLEIYRFVVSPLPACLSTLQDLAINLKNLGDSTLEAMTPECLVNVLAQSPRLVSLKLYFSPQWGHYYPPDCPLGSERPDNLEPPTYTHRCRLPHLRKLDFQCPFLFAASVLTEVDAPAVTFFHLNVASRFAFEPSEIARRLFPSSLRNIADGKTALFVESMGDHGFGIRDFEPRTMMEWHRKDPRNQLAFHYFDLTNTLHPLDAALSTLCTAFSSPTLQSLDVFEFTDPPSGAPHAAWLPLFPAFPALRSLRMNNHPEVVSSFLMTFGPLTTQSPSVPWPVLCSLYIDTTRCSCDGIANPCGPLSSDDAHDFFQQVLEAVRARAEREVPLATFRFEPSVRKWCGVAAHRWILYSISLLCGEFTLESGGHGRVFRSGFWDLFSAAERRRLADKPRGEDSEATTDADGTSAHLIAEKTTQPADSEEDGSKDTGGDPEGTTGSRYIEDNTVEPLSAGVRMVCECELCVETLVSIVSP